MININIKKISISTVSGNSSGVFVGNNFLPNSDSFSKSNTNVSGNNVSDSVNILIDKDGIDFGVIDKDDACQVVVSNTGKNDASVTTTTNKGSSSNGSSGNSDSSSSGSSGNNGSSSSGSSSSRGSASSTGTSNSGSQSSNGSASSRPSNSTGSTSSNTKKNNNGYTKEISVNYHSLFSGPNA